MCVLAIWFQELSFQCWSTKILRILPPNGDTATYKAVMLFSLKCVCAIGEVHKLLDNLLTYFWRNNCIKSAVKETTVKHRINQFVRQSVCCIHCWKMVMKHGRWHQIEKDPGHWNESSPFDQRSCRDRLRSEDIRSELGVKVILQYVDTMQLKWYGHIKRMPDDRLPHTVEMETNLEVETNHFQASWSSSEVPDGQWW